MDWSSCFSSPNQASGAATLSCIPVLFSNIVNAAFLFLGAVTIIFIIVSGLKFILSGGDAKQVEGARNTLTYAIIGLVVIVFSYAIINLIATITNTHCITQFGFSNCK